MGNAAFHSSALYPLLAPAIGPLVASLSPDAANNSGGLTSHLITQAQSAEDRSKARANASGALGNLARNGGTLAAAMASHGAPVALLRLALAGLEEDTKDASDSEEAARRTALFALGTLAAYPSCREAIVALSATASSSSSSSSSSPSLVTLAAAVRNQVPQDEVMLKYLGRLKTKLAQPPASE